jgi:hypothetical protein
MLKKWIIEQLLSLLCHRQLSERLQNPFWKEEVGVIRFAEGRKKFNLEEPSVGCQLWLMADGRGR